MGFTPARKSFPGAAAAGNIAVMCGRYASFLPAEAVARLFGVIGPLPNVAASWNVAPTQNAMAVRRHPDSGERRLDLLSWGLVPHFTKDLKAARRPINSRAETIATSGMFRGALAARRCLVPADAFYEWRVADGDKQPFAIARRDGQPMAFAGLWEGWRSPDGEVLRSFVIVTTTANATLRPLHERMPVVLESADWPRWLGEAPVDPLTLLRPAAEDVLHFWPVGRRVGNVRNNDAGLLAPIEATATTPAAP
jgi:putative SOS response-associated peptidase YedK